MSNRGISRLAQVLAGQISQQTDSPDVLELGTVQVDLSLLVDRFPIPIPPGDYLVCRHLTLPDPLVITEETEAHTHVVPRPQKLAPLKPGDRVLVAWVNDGTDPVVIDVVGVMTGA